MTYGSVCSGIEAATVTNPDCDHVIPLSRGGSHDDENLVTACVRCNRSKGAKLCG